MRVDERVARDLAPRQVQLEAMFEREPLKFGKQVVAPLPAPPLI